LDSLADMVTFGVVPGVVMFHLIKHSLFCYGIKNLASSTNFITDVTNVAANAPIYVLLPYIAFLITIFSCIRLAKFNIDTRQTNSFIGVPTPANTILICSFPLILGLNQVDDSLNLFSGIDFAQYALTCPDVHQFSFITILLNPYFLVGLTLLMSYLLIAELPLFALKFKNFGWQDNKIRYSFLIISLILLILFQFIAISFIIFLYIFLSIINNVVKKNNA